MTPCSLRCSPSRLPLEWYKMETLWTSSISMMFSKKLAWLEWPKYSSKSYRSWENSFFPISSTWPFLLHQDIPYRLTSKSRSISFLNSPENPDRPEDDQPDEDVQEVEEQDHLRPPVHSSETWLPFNTSKCWFKEEEAMINPDPKLSHLKGYKQFQKACLEKKMHAGATRLSTTSLKLLVKNKSACKYFLVSCYLFMVCFLYCEKCI